MTWFNPNQDFSENPDFGIQQNQIDRKRELAKAMMAKGNQGQQGQMVSGWYVAPSKMSYVNQLAQTLIGTFGQKAADGEQSKLLAKGLEEYKSANSPSIETSFDQSRLEPMGPPQQAEPSPQIPPPAQTTPVDMSGPVEQPLPKQGTPNNAQLAEALSKAQAAPQPEAPTAVVQESPNVQTTSPSWSTTPDANGEKWGSTGTAVTKQTAPDPLKQQMALLNLAQIQGPIGDMARAKISQMGKQDQFTVHSDGTGGFVRLNNHTGEVVPVQGAGTGVNYKAEELSLRKREQDFRESEAKDNRSDKHVVQAKADAEKSKTIQQQLITLNELESSYQEMADLISAGKDPKTGAPTDPRVSTGRVAGPLGDISGYLPGKSSKDVDRFKTLSGDTLVARMQSMHGLGSLSDKDVAALSKTLPSLSLDPQSNLQNIQQALATIRANKSNLTGALGGYQAGNAPEASSGVPARGATFNGPTGSKAAGFSW